MEKLSLNVKQVARHQNTVQNGQEVQAHPHQAAHQAQAHHQVAQAQVHQAQAHQAAAAAQNQWKMDIHVQMRSCQYNVSVK